jgi:hypothetical protein
MVHLSLQARARQERQSGAEQEGKTAAIGHKKSSDSLTEVPLSRP